MAPSSTSPPSQPTAHPPPPTTHSFSHPLPNAETPTTEEKTKYLSALRTATTKLQSEINAFLTAKMEEDKKAAIDTAAAGEKKVRIEDDEKAEEEYEEEYGEEVVEEE